MNVCMLLRGSFPPDVRVRKEATALLEAGHDVRLLCPAADRPSAERVDGIDVRRLGDVEAYDTIRGLARAGRFLVTGRHPGWEQALRTTLDAWPVDVVHVHDLPLVGTALAVHDDVDGPPVVADLHERYPAASRQWRGPRSAIDPTDVEAILTRALFPVRRLERFERQAVRRADATLAVVEEARQHYVACGADPGDVHVVSNTVDLERFDASSTDPPAVPDGPLLSYVGTLSGRHRGLETAIDAMAHLDDRDAHLLLVGAGSHEATLRECVDDRGLADRVTFTGWVEFDRVPAYMAASDVGLVPHRDTPHTATTVPHKLFQYMAAETPVVCSDVRPLARILGETGAGTCFAAGDPAALADAVASLLDDPSRSAACGRRGRAAVECEYNWARDADRLRDVYAGLA